MHTNSQTNQSIKKQNMLNRNKNDDNMPLWNSHWTDSKRTKKEPITQIPRKILPMEVLFQYTGTQKYVRLIEKVKISQDEEVIMRSFILDEELSIVTKKVKQIIDIEKYKSDNESENINNITFTIENQPKKVLKSYWYQSYPQLHDFQIGREYWGRNPNSLKISSDLISRCHTRITCKGQQATRQRQELQRILMEIMSKKLRVSSLWKKIPISIWNIILEFATTKACYTIMDCGSRNGTFLLDCFKYENRLSSGQSYQFEQEQYIIHINKVVSLDGTEAASKIQQFKTHIDKSSNGKHVLQVILPQNQKLSELLQKLSVNLIYFQVDFSYDEKYYFCIINFGQNRSYYIGQGQQINIKYNSNQLYFITSRHGRILFQNSKWIIQPINPTQKMWFKLPTSTQFQLDVRNKYRVRLGHINTLDLQFYNYDKPYLDTNYGKEY